MSLMLIMSFNIVMAWWVFTHPVFPSSPQDFPSFFPPANIFIVHMFQSSKVKIWQNEWYLQQTFQSPSTLWTLCHSVFIGRFEWLCQALAWLLCYYFFSQLIVSVALVKAFQSVALLLKMYLTSDFHWVSESSSSLFSLSNAWIMASLLSPH